MGARLKNCVTHPANTAAAVHFIDLDGTQRERKTTIVGFDREKRVEEISIRVPVSRHPVDSANLADPRLGLLDAINDKLQRLGLEYARVDLLVDSAERNVGLTVNEYETLLIKHDLVEVLQNPLRFARIKGRHMIEDPLSIPAKTVSYAQYDAVRILNSFMVMGIPKSIRIFRIALPRSSSSQSGSHPASLTTMIWQRRRTIS